MFSILAEHIKAYEHAGQFLITAIKKHLNLANVTSRCVRRGATRLPRHI